MLDEKDKKDIIILLGNVTLNGTTTQVAPTLLRINELIQKLQQDDSKKKKEN